MFQYQILILKSQKVSLLMTKTILYITILLYIEGWLGHYAMEQIKWIRKGLIPAGKSQLVRFEIHVHVHVYVHV